MDFKFHTEPTSHQREEFELSKNLTSRAVFWDQGTGKTKLQIDQAVHNYLLGRIDCVVVIAPSGVHRNWIEDELILHLSSEIFEKSIAFAYKTEAADRKWHQKALEDIIQFKGLVWFSISYDGFMTKRGKEFLIELFHRRNVYYVADESHNLRNWDAKRTASIVKSAAYAVMRRVLTGTPVSTGPLNIYPQFAFLDPSFWKNRGFSSYGAYRSHFCELGKLWNPNAMNWSTKKKGTFVEVITGYKNLEELQRIIAPYITRVLKDDVLDLKPKRYHKCYFELTPEQRRLYEELKEESVTWLSIDYKQEVQEQQAQICDFCGGSREIEYEGYIYPCPSCSTPAGVDENEGVPIAAQLAITKLIRFQQIVCGYVMTEEGELVEIPGGNPRLDLLESQIKNADTKALIWAKFTKDIDLIMDRLTSLGLRVGRYDGQVGDDERAEVKYRFQGVRPIFHERKVIGREEVPWLNQLDYFVGNPAAAATGLTLTAAKRSFYYNNSFNLIDRRQSEDRNHRYGQEDEVEYFDVIAANSVDEKIVTALRNNFNIAALITGDELVDWL